MLYAHIFFVCVQWDAHVGCRTRSWQLSVSIAPSGPALLLSLSLHVGAPGSKNPPESSKLVETLVVAFPVSDATGLLKDRINHTSDHSTKDGDKLVNGDSPLVPGEVMRRWRGENEEWSSDQGKLADLCVQISGPMLLMLRALRFELATHVAALSHSRDCDTLQKWVVRLLSTARNAKTSRPPKISSEYIRPPQLSLQRLLSNPDVADTSTCVDCCYGAIGKYVKGESDPLYACFGVCLVTGFIVALARIFCWFLQ